MVLAIRLRPRPVTRSGVKQNRRRAYVKVGSTAGPRARFEALRSEAHRVGPTVSRAWLSPAHPERYASL